MTGQIRRRLLVVLAGLLVGAACSSDPPAPTAAPTTEAGEFEAKPTISLVVNDWTGSALNVAVAEQVIEFGLGYPVVAVRLDDTTGMYDEIAEGNVDAVLEVWPSAVTERDQRFFDRGQVVQLGELGVVGRVGWFVPRYVVDDDPSLDTWEGFASNDVAARFATSATRPQGRFLGTNPDYRQFDADIIDNLGLPFEVEFSGSEAATMAELDESVSERDPILLYWWTPTAAVAAYDLVRVELPEADEECLAAFDSGVGDIDCDYQPDVLIKVASTDLATKAPQVQRFLQAFELTNDDQARMLNAVEIQGATIDAAAADWIDSNPEVYQGWLDAARSGPADDGEATDGAADDGEG
ncbi:MAG: glycine betaine ABC transporter substrate-binding protein [Actinomycetota bacterium]